MFREASRQPGELAPQFRCGAFPLWCRLLLPETMHLEMLQGLHTMRRVRSQPSPTPQRGVGPADQQDGRCSWQSHAGSGSLALELSAHSINVGKYLAPGADTHENAASNLSQPVIG